MQTLELLAPARNAQIGIAAIDCGADAVYIAGPDFGARKAAGNSFEDVALLCDYAHRFGARVFVTFNTVFSEAEAPEVHRQMLLAQDAGADAFIIREAVICTWADIRVPLHASTQCAIRTAERAKYYADLGCSRIVLERQLSLAQVAAISQAVSCEIEFFVHGALCVCYSGDCRLSEFINGRSADKGDCMQACRSLYDLVDESGKVLVRNKALLSLKDYKLLARVGELAEAGVCSFKIEGRLKNASYVRNVVRDYDAALNDLVARHPERYRRASFGRVESSFIPDTDKTFNRGYTELFLDARRGQWSSMDAPKSMGEYVGTVARVLPDGLQLRLASQDLSLHNGDGFAFISSAGVQGFRGDVCSGASIKCAVKGLAQGTRIYRNFDAAFEQVLANQLSKRFIKVSLALSLEADMSVSIVAKSEDGRELRDSLSAGSDMAQNVARMRSVIVDQLSKRTGSYEFAVTDFVSYASLPFLSASEINSARRRIAAQLDLLPCGRIPMAGEEPQSTAPSSLLTDTSGRDLGKFSSADGHISHSSIAHTLADIANSEARSLELMRSKYCIRYELGLCHRYQRAKGTKALYLINNGRRFALHFDCSRCEMTLTAA